MNIPKMQCEMLMNDLVEFSQNMLGLHGEFHPYGGYINMDESIVHVGISPEVKWESDKQRMDALLLSFIKLAGEKAPLAFGVVSNVTLSDKHNRSDAIRIFLEHISGYCADVFMHYKIIPGGVVEIVNVTAQQGIPTIFSKTGSGTHRAV